MAKSIQGVLGEKLGMTQVFDANNRIIPVTVVKAGPCVVTQVRTPEKDGYSAVQIAYGPIDPRKVNKPEAGHFAKAGVPPRRYLVEIRTDDAAALHRRPGDHRRGLHARRGRHAEGRRRRHQQGQGLRRCHEAPQLQGPRRRPRRAAQAPLARLHRRLRHACPRLQGHAHGRPHGPRAHHDAEPHDPRHGRRARPAAHQGRRPRSRAAAWSSSAPPPRAASGRVVWPSEHRNRHRTRRSPSTSARRTARLGPHRRAARRGLRRAGQHPDDPPGRRGAAGRRPSGHAQHQDPRRGPRWWAQALPPEGHRPRPPGLDPRAAVRRRWRRARPSAARLQPADAQEDEGRRPARCAVRPRPPRPRPRRQLAVDDGRPEHQERRRPAARDQHPRRTCSSSPSATTRSAGSRCATPPRCTS